jgi:hypothetical protein
MKQSISYLCTLKKAYDSVRREVLYNTLIDFGISMKLVRLIKMCLTETCSKVRVFKHFSDIHQLLKTNKCTTMYCVYSKTRICLFLIIGASSKCTVQQ